MLLQNDILDTPPPQLSQAQARLLLREFWQIEAETFKKLASERDCNFKVESAKGEFVLKLANSAEAPAVTALQTQALLHIAQKNPDLAVPRMIPTRDGHAQAIYQGASLRLLTYLPGLPLHLASRSPQQTQNIATAHAELAKALQDFRYEAAKPFLQWDIQHAAGLAHYLPDLPDSLRSSIADVLQRFRQYVTPILPDLRRQFGHSDLNPFNIRVQENAPDQLAGFLDFGDMVETPLICDVAVGAAYQLHESLEAFADVGLYTGAFHRHMPLTEQELDILPELIMARLATTLCIATVRAKAQPENRDYILRNVPAAQQGLERLLHVPRQKALDMIRKACA